MTNLITTDTSFLIDGMEESDVRKLLDSSISNSSAEFSLKVYQLRVRDYMINLSPDTAEELKTLSFSELMSRLLLTLKDQLTEESYEYNKALIEKSKDLPDLINSNL